MTETEYPISEIFGPTIQGEGPLVGTRTFFVRFAGCDFDCSWCDTKYAVSPKYEGWSKTMMTAREISDQLEILGILENDWITFSGGNPALFVDDALCQHLVEYRTAMETQGSKALLENVTNWLDCLIVSPKAPSSGMAQRMDFADVSDILMQRRDDQLTALKYVAFTDKDIRWIKDFTVMINPPDFVKLYISAGTPLPTNIVSTDNEGEDRISVLDDSRLIVCDSYTSLVERVLKDPEMKDFTVGLQTHVLVWGQKRGV